VLRERDVDIAILETARGGLLRRGLGVNKANAALITNIARDHLGDFGSQNLDELLNCKWIVSRVVSDDGKLILNADDPLLVAKSRGFSGELVWFSLDAYNAIVQAHAAAGGSAFVLDDHDMLFVDGDSRELICRDHDVPITLDGAARHNVANALAAAALTWSLGISLADIRAGLMTLSQGDNPGRCNVYAVKGFTVLVDFAHNPQALQALLEMANRLPSRRKALCFGQAGDRPDDLIRELARRAWESGLDRVFVSELAKYHRGREEGAVFAVIRDELIACGAGAEQIEHHMEEIESLDSALEWAKPGDLIIMLALERSQKLYDKLKSM
jgi:UDP-N-acetylmuramyl tripeptide synthase